MDQKETKKINVAYTFDSDYFYVGQITVQESPLEPGVFLLPPNSTLKSPIKLTIGKTNRFVDGDWVLVDIAQKPPIISRTDVILRRLEQIDQESIRPLRAITSNTKTSKDILKIESLESEAANLRVELSDYLSLSKS